MKQSIPRLTLVWKNKGLCALKWQNTLMPVVGTFQLSEKSLISAKRCGMRRSIQAWERITHNSAASNRERQRQRDRERGNLGSVVIMWHSASRTTCIARHRLFIKLKWNVGSSCGTLAKQATLNPRFCYIICGPVSFAWVSIMWERTTVRQSSLHAPGTWSWTLPVTLLMGFW